MRIRDLAILAASLMGFALSSSGASAQGAPVDTYSNFAWHNISQLTCIERATVAVDTAIDRFAIAKAATNHDDWYVIANAGDVVVWVYCIADDETDEVVAPAARRVLVFVNVSTSRPGFGAELRDFLADCMAGECPAVAVAATRIGWEYSPIAFRGRTGERVGFVCPPLGGAFFGAVWGTDLYTDDSPICVAAVHAGAITTAAGGTVTIEIAPSQQSYLGTERNGIMSGNWGPYGGSYRVILPGG